VKRKPDIADHTTVSELQLDIDRRLELPVVGGTVVLYGFTCPTGISISGEWTVKELLGRKAFLRRK
jgi:hypothetical protein